MNKLYLIIIGILTLAVIGSQYYSRAALSNKEEEIRKWQNEAAKKDTVHIFTTDSTLVRKLSLQVDEISAENKEMKKALKKNDETIRSLNSLVAFWQAKAETLATDSGDVIVTPGGDSIRTRTFLTADDFRTLAGKFEIDSPYRFYLSREEFLLKLRVYNTEARDGSYSTIVKSVDPRLKITDIQTEVVPYKHTWKDNLYFWGGIGGDLERPFSSERNLGRVGIAAGLGLFNQRFSYNLTTDGQYIKYEYELYKWRIF